MSLGQLHRINIFIYSIISINLIYYISKASITAQPVPPAVGSSTRKLLGSEQKAAVSSSVSVELEVSNLKNIPNFP